MSDTPSSSPLPSFSAAVAELVRRAAPERGFRSFAWRGIERLRLASRSRRRRGKCDCGRLQDPRRSIANHQRRGPPRRDPRRRRRRPLPRHRRGRGEGRPLFTFAGLWTGWRGVRGPESAPVEGEHKLFGFLTTGAKAIVAPIHPKGHAGYPDDARRGDLWLAAETHDGLARCSDRCPTTRCGSWRRTRRRTASQHDPHRRHRKSVSCAEPNAVDRHTAVRRLAVMPVFLTTSTEVDRRLEAETASALELQRPLLDDGLRMASGRTTRRLPRRGIGPVTTE